MSDPVAIARLTPRERECLGLVARQMDSKEIARALDLSPFTVRNHLSRIMQTVGVTNRTDLLAMHGKQAEPQLES